MLRRSGVKRCPGGELLTGPGVLVPLPPEYPLSTRCLRCTLAHQRCHLILTRAPTGVDIVGTVSIAQQVNMRIDKTGKNGFATQIHQFALLTTNAAYLIIITDRYNASARAVDSQRLCSWLRSIHGVNRAVQEENGAHTCSSCYA